MATHPHPTIATPTLTTDIVLFRPGPVSSSPLPSRDTQVLLIRRGRGAFVGSWALPGGKLHTDESLEECAARELKEETSIHGVDLAQVAAFSLPGRDPRGHYVTVAFYGLVGSTVEGRAGDDAADLKWFSLGTLPSLRLEVLPPLACDHSDILRAALKVAFPGVWSA